MATIADDTHAVSSAAVVGCFKVQTGSAPHESFMVFVYVADQCLTFRWDDEGARDDFYKQLVEAMT